MNSPYEILGLAPDASEAQIKRAYKDLAKQASALPPEEAERRMAELDNAYDAIINSRFNMTDYSRIYATDASYRQQNNTESYENSFNNSYTDIRELILQNRLSDAEMLLDGMPSASRNAEWHYLKGTICTNKGWLDHAVREYEAAYRMEPSNREYRCAYEEILKKQSGGYRNSHQRTGGAGSASCCEPSGCDICSGLCCADCCCESLGGDLIPCC